MHTRHYWVTPAVFVGLLGQAAAGQVGLTISGSASPARGSIIGYLAQSDPPGLAIDQFNWTYSWGNGSNVYQDNDSDGDNKSLWSGRMVVNGTLSCSAIVSGINVTKTISISIAPRAWAVPLSCVEDNEPTWGEAPTAGTGLCGRRDRDSDTFDVFVPRDSGGTWDPAFTLSLVSSGPCQGWYYVSSSTLKCQQETVVNRYLKTDGPTLGGVNFVTANSDRNCLYPSAGALVTALMNHEYRGTPPTAKSLEGHFGAMEMTILDLNHDAKQHIEPLVSRDAAALRIDVNDTIEGDESAVRLIADDESYMATYGPNWGSDPGSLGYGQHSRWDPNSLSWTDCVWGPSNF